MQSQCADTFILYVLAFFSTVFVLFFDENATCNTARSAICPGQYCKWSKKMCRHALKAKRGKCVRKQEVMTSRPCDIIRCITKIDPKQYKHTSAISHITKKVKERKQYCSSVGLQWHTFQESNHPYSDKVWTCTLCFLLLHQVTSSGSLLKNILNCASCLIFYWWHKCASLVGP